ncbi:branched-chain amino acid transporter AzlC [Lachnoanaerobaculum gingivalis]|uniref:Branched-chain amino acid transporter AzlC n=1 Tax=Lachnoanaerobaculum gingivalis TaxID=2490855 RepID=A0A3P3R2N2_9FIRM|nr:AzlC family ABC transporter permease [Lachnoanaerobaculum gingivalis]RRJ26843.1 branched-chain amino acid transporter AzlC [Lachnoanaerobaculum gingivalis]
MVSKNKIKSAFFSAFPNIIPILAGFLFLGIAYGIYMNQSGFKFYYPMFMSFIIFAGSVEFATVSWLLGSFDPVNIFFLTLMINARHLFYGLSMLEKYNIPGWKKLYLIYGMCDESFSINTTVDVPKDIDKDWFMFFVTMLNQIYWVAGATIGGIFGSFIPFDTKGIEFVMTALFVVIFLENWLKEKYHSASVIGLFISFICLMIFKGTNFIIPSMIIIITVLTLLRGRLEKHE